MSTTRRSFLQSAALAAGLAGPVPLAAQTARPAGQSPATAASESEIKIPRVPFGKTQISRLVLGANPFYGYGHFNRTLEVVMREWYTTPKVVEVLHQAEKLGINAFNYVHSARGQADWQRFQAEDGRMHLICQGNTDDPGEVISAVKPMAMWVQGERVDNAFRAGRMNTIRDYCKKIRGLGVVVGVGTHIPEVLALVEEQGWDVDFYAGCVYNRRRTPDELRKLLGGELPEMPGEVYLRDDPPRMYRFMKQTRKPCFAFKILAAGRVQSPEQAFRLAFQSLKPTDFVVVGVFPRIKDEVKENASWATRYGA